MHKVINYFRDGMWQQPLANATESNLKKHALHYLKIFTLSAYGFINDHGSLRASALTLYTVLSIVPIIAMLFGIAKGFGFEKTLEQQILEQVPEQDSLILQLIEMAKNMLGTTQGGLVAGIGIIVLFWTVLKVISNIEESFNHIWHVKKARSIGRKLSDYLSLMLLAPVMIIAANSINIFVQVQLTTLINVIALPGTFIALHLLSYLPIIILWGLFSFIFIFMPNTKVTYRAGFFAGIIAGTVYYIVQFLYVTLQVGVSSYNAIYGSFAALPLFLIWLQIAWIIVLFGSELSFYFQNIELYQFNQKYQKLSFCSKTNIAIHIMHSIKQRFTEVGAKPYSAEEVSLELKIPISIVQIVMSELLTSQLVSQIIDDDTEDISYQPAHDMQLLTDEAIVEALKNNGEAYTIPDNLG